MKVYHFIHGRHISGRGHLEYVFGTEIRSGKAWEELPDQVEDLSQDQFTIKFSVPSANQSLKNAESVGGSSPTQLSRLNTQNSTQTSIMLRLFIELRLVIYEKLFGGFVLKFSNYRNAAYNEDPPIEKPRHLFGLLRTCKQIYAESSLLFYSINSFSTFSIPPYREYKQTFERFVESRTQAQLGAIRSISYFAGGLPKHHHRHKDSYYRTICAYLSKFLTGVDKIVLYTLYDGPFRFPSLSEKTIYQKMYKQVQDALGERRAVVKFLHGRVRREPAMYAQGITIEDSTLRWRTHDEFINDTRLIEIEKNI